MNEINELAPPPPPNPPKKKGWPKGKPRKPKLAVDREPVHAPVHQKPKSNANATLITRNGKTYEYVADDDNDRLRIDPSLIPDGMTYLWVTDSILGQPQPQWRARRARTGWTPVPASRHDGMFMPKGFEGEINVDGLVLCEKPIEFVNRDRKRDQRNAVEQVWVRERQMMGGDIGAQKIAFDTQHPTAIRSNRVKKSYERIDIPE